MKCYKGAFLTHASKYKVCEDLKLVLREKRLEVQLLIRDVSCAALSDAASDLPLFSISAMYVKLALFDSQVAFCILSSL